jgi:hypothetical protein
MFGFVAAPLSSPVTLGILGSKNCLSNPSVADEFGLASFLVEWENCKVNTIKEMGNKINSLIACDRLPELATGGGRADHRIAWFALGGCVELGYIL